MSTFQVEKFTEWIDLKSQQKGEEQGFDYDTYLRENKKYFYGEVEHSDLEKLSIILEKLGITEDDYCLEEN